MITSQGLQYLGGALVVALVILRLYFPLANKLNIIDRPNERSSHKTPTIRGGGVVFPLIVIILASLGQLDWRIAAAVVIAGVIGFWDDIRPLRQLPRLIAHIIVFGCLVWSLSVIEIWPIWMTIIGLVFFLGWVNAFNFMDGINGITILYTLVCLGTFYLIPELRDQDTVIIAMIGAALVFAFFNVRKNARAFAGDVGSISLAVVIGYLMLALIIQTGNMSYLLFLLLYGVDSICTILIRLSRKENVFEAHRSHLYQLLANERQLGHLPVAFGYAFSQAIINIAAYVWAIPYNPPFWMLVLIVAASMMAYLLVRKQVDNRPLLTT